MRVCMMNDNFYRSSGAAIAIKRIALSLVDVEIFVAAGEQDERSQDLSWIPEGRYARFNLKSSNPLVVLQELRRFKRWFRTNHCDLVHCHHRRVSSLIQFAGIPVLYTGQLAFGNERWFRWFHPKQMSAITNSVAENLLETTGRKVLACISNPVEFPDAAPVVHAEVVKDRAVSIARLEPVKGHVHLLAAWKILLDRGHRYHLDLVGEGTLRPQLEDQVAKAGLSDLIHFVGFRTDIESVVSQSLFAILVSEMEGQGIVTLEAAASGRASLLTAVPGSVDLLPPDRQLPNGLPFGDVHKLANALEQWFSRPEKVVEEGERFFRFLKTSSDPAAIAREYRKLYEQVIAKAT